MGVKVIGTSQGTAFMSKIVNPQMCTTSFFVLWPL